MEELTGTIDADDDDGSTVYGDYKLAGSASGGLFG